MILAAGKGTRLESLTNKTPKALVEIHGKPLLERVIDKLKRSGFTDIIINVHHFADQVIEFIELTNFGVHIELSDECDQLLDTGGGILHAKKFFQGEEAFLAYNVDILSDIDLFDLYKAHINSDAIATLAVKERPTSRQLLFDTLGNLCQWRNIETGATKNARRAYGELSPFAFSGIHMLSTKIFEQITETQSFSIIDTYLRLAKDFPIKSYIHNYSKWFDMGRYQHVVEFNKRKKMIEL